ncbi:MAG: 3'-5' exonuclease [Pseudomonas sp.]|nr:3'-5' exonuclease [Pseudomonas sp.]
MSLLNWLKPCRAQLPADQLRRREQLRSAAPLSDGPLNEQRLVVLDLETSGLNTNKDLVLSIGAVVIEHGAIDLGQQFECTLQRAAQPHNQSVLIHGLGPSAIAAGCDPAEGLLACMEFIGASPVLGFHAPFDQRMLSRALKTSLNYSLQHPFIDLADLAPLLYPDAGIHKGGLDDWLKHCGLQIAERHNAGADALVTAELALMLFSRARRQDLNSLLAIEQRLTTERRRQQAHRL